MKKIALILLIVSSIFGSALVVAGEFQRVQLRGETGSQRTAEISDVIFGPVSTNDTLWRIARDYRNSSEFAADRPASLYPVMYGIYVLNPKAFKDNNVNQLLDNAMLELPSPDFVAAINLDMARAKIEGDEDAVGYIDPTESPTDSSNKNSTVVSTPKAKSTSVALNPVTLTSNELQILNELKKQYAVSLETIQVLLDENELLSDQLQHVSQQLTSLSNRVDGDVQEQLDAQAELQAQLYALLQNANLLNKAESQSTFFSDIKALLKEPMVMIALLSGIVLAALIALGMWLFARTPKLSDVVPEEPAVDAAPDIIELSEADLEVPADSLFTNTDATAVDELITDDLLSDELLNDELLSDDLLDENVLTETDDLEQQLRDEIQDIDFEESSGELAQSALDELFGSGDLATAPELVDDGDALIEAIDVSNDIDDILNEELIEPGSASIADDYDFDIDSLLDEVAEEVQSEKVQKAPTDVDEIPDELADLADELSRSALPDTLEIDEDAGLSEADVASLELEISMQGQHIDSTVDDLFNEIEQIEMMESMLGESFSAGEDTDDEPIATETNSELDHSDILDDELNAEMDMQDALTEDVLEELLNDADLSEINDVISPANDTLSAEPEPEPMSKMASSLLDDLPDIGGWMLHENDESELDDLENTDFDELLQSLENNDEDEPEVNTKGIDDLLDEDLQQVLAANDVTQKIIDNTPDFIDVDALLDDISSELTEEPEIDLLKNLEGMPQPVNDEDMTIDDAFSSDLDLARAYIEIDEIREAQKLLKKVLAKGSSEQQDEAKLILEQLENL
ncbi:MAG: FimV/HubP family polar landmark protein [Glaciecola sp.]